MKTEDGAIIYKCLNGDREAFAILIDKYKAGIYAYVCAKLNNMDDAEDVTQEVFIRAYRDLPKLRRWDIFAYWLYSIATYQCRNWIRAKSKSPDCEYQDPNKLEKILAERAIESSKDKKIDESLHEALDSLPEIYREVLMLYYMSGMNSEQIANMLAISPESIRQRLTRARAMLREEIITMMDRTLPQHKLQASFTFRIVEAIKRIKISPSAQTRGLPWGLSLATGLLITILSINPAFITLREFGTPIFAPLPSESKVLNIGEIPIDVVKTSNIMMLSNAMGNGKGGELKKPDMENAFFMAPQGEGGKWEKRADMPTGRLVLSVAEVNGKIYAIGGLVSSENEEYDPKLDKWTKKTKMPTARFGHSTTAINGKIYAIGGSNAGNQGILSVVEEYDPKADSWQRKKDMPDVKYYHSAVAINNKIYIFGGSIVGDKASLSVLVYDPIIDQWQRLKDIPEKHHVDGSVALALDNKVYFFGGASMVDWALRSNILVYDIQNDNWKVKSEFPTKRYVPTAGMINRKIYLIGGVDMGLNGFSTVEEYNIDEDQWEVKTDMPSRRGYFGTSQSCVIDNRIYVIGGIINSWPNATAINEVYTPDDIKSVDPSGKLPQTWGDLKTK
jgi:RNA polymerase sigma factor (sigma-70 family)